MELLLRKCRRKVNACSLNPERPPAVLKFPDADLARQAEAAPGVAGLGSCEMKAYFRSLGLRFLQTFYDSTP